jgi:hypothetical protein
MKKGSPKALKSAHTSNSKIGMGDYYGSGVKQKMGKVKEGLGTSSMSPKKLGKPPKSLA